MDEFKKQLRRFLTQWAYDKETQPPEHVQILARGAKVWNEWRSQNPSLIPNLFRADLRGQYLSGVDFRKANLTRADLSDTDLTNANLEAATLRKALFVRTNLFRANLTRTDLRGAILANAHLRETAISGAVLGDTVIAQTDLSLTLGLSDIRHVHASDIGIGTLSASKLSLPLSLLRDAGIAEQLIEYLPILSQEPV